MDKGISDNMYDDNGNGDLDIFEQTAEFAFRQEAVSKKAASRL